VEIKMGVDYPRSRPEINWLTPIQHPNIWGHGTVCLGNYSNAWTPHFRLVDVVEILWDMARLAVLNPRSAGTGAYKAEENWDRLYRKYDFPVDRRPLRDPAFGNNEGSSRVRPGGEETEIVIFPEDDESCPT
jgi:ubiquitin-protein ligase